MNTIKSFTKAALAAALVLFGSSLYAQDYDQLSIDNDYEPNEAGYYYIDLPQNGTKEVYLSPGQTIKVYDHHGKNGPLVAKESSDGRLLIHAADGCELQVTGKTDAMKRNVIQQRDDNWLSAYEDAEQSEEITTLVRNSDNIYFASSGNTMLILLHIKTPYIYDDQYGLELTVSQVQSTSHSITVATSANGTIESDKNTAATRETVTLTVNPASGYLLKHINLSNGTTIGEDQWYSGENTFTFNMPSQEVTLTPVFTNNLTSEELSINVNPSINKTYVIPNGVQSFNISIPSTASGHSVTSVIQASNGCVIKATGYVHFVSLSNNNESKMTIYDGSNTSSGILMTTEPQYEIVTLSIGYIWSNYNYMTINLYQDFSMKISYSGRIEIFKELTYDNVADIFSQTYTGSAIEPEVEVKDGETTLALGTDYTVAYSNNINAGTATAKITGKGKYTRTVTKTFAIIKELTASDITDISSQTYTGSAIEPEVEVKDGEITLVLGTDYTVAYSNNINAGTASVTITGKGYYSGTVEKTFKINPKVTTNGALTLSEYSSTLTKAEIQGDFKSTDDKQLIIQDPITVNSVTFKREFIKDIPSTIMLPFYITTDDEIGSFYTLASVAPDKNGVWTADLTKVEGVLNANTPYIFKVKENITEANYLTFANVELQPTTTINDNTNGYWTLHGVYKKTRLDDPDEVNYGFAGAKADGISIGDFVRAGDGTWADPMRCYLTYSGNDSRLTKAALDLPDYIKVVFHDEEEQPDNGEIVTPVSSISESTGVKAWSYNGTIFIDAQPDMDYTIVDLTGRIIKKGVTHSTREEITLSATGIVIVKIGNKSFKLK